MNKTLTAILQPLVKMVPKFVDFRHVENWVADCFPCGSNSAAAIASLAKWKQGYAMMCPLCREGDKWSCFESCPLEKVAEGACRNHNSLWAKAKDGDKQPLIDALELASVYALVNEFREKCEATIEEVIK